MVTGALFFPSVFVNFAGLDLVLEGRAQQDVIDAQTFVSSKGRFSVVPPRELFLRGVQLSERIKQADVE